MHNVWQKQDAFITAGGRIESFQLLCASIFESKMLSLLWAGFQKKIVQI
jgi:hypothetical protein